MRNIWLGAVLGVVTLVLGACSSSYKPASGSAASGGAVVGVAIPNQVSVVTANNAN